ncbi:MAG: hypothetical protein J6Y55_11150 [Bacteroidales bacterium]|nr:hypothetical protein [Bacteroidales bacterium]
MIQKQSETLYLPIKEKWIQMILAGEKTEDYRNETDYWAKRLFDEDILYPRKFKFICFHNYKDSWWFYYKGLNVGLGNIKWGAPPNKIVYKIQIGKFIKKSKYSK